MATLIKCDACGTAEETSGTMIPTPVVGLPFLRPELPDGWRRVSVPMPDGSAWTKEICPADLRRLWDLFGVTPDEPTQAEIDEDEAEPTVCVACEHKPEDHEGSGPCARCACVLSPVECLDPQWADLVAKLATQHHVGRGHDFVGDEDTCVADPHCPVTWGEFQAWRKGARV